MKLHLFCIVLFGTKLVDCTRSLHYTSQYSLKGHKRYDFDLYTTEAPTLASTVGTRCEDNNIGNTEAQELNCPLTKPPDELQKLKEQMQNLQEELDKTKRYMLKKTRQAARALEIATTAKKEIVKLLEFSVQETREDINREVGALEQNEMACGDMMRGVRDIQATVDLLSRAVHLAEVLKTNAEYSAKGAQERYQLMQKQLEIDRNREEHLKKKLEESKNELENTRDAAENARTAAQGASQNTRRDQRKIVYNVEILGAVQ